MKTAKIIGIDIGLKTSSTAIAVLEHDGVFYSIKYVQKIGPFESYHTKKSNFTLIIEWVTNILSTIISLESPDCLTIEEAFLPGKANKNFLKFLGVLENKIFKEFNPILLAPLQIKKFLGSGKLDKKELAEATKKYFVDKKDINLINKAINNEEWDVTDSIAIAICGVIKHES